MIRGYGVGALFAPIFMLLTGLANLLGKGLGAQKIPPNPSGKPRRPGLGAQIDRPRPELRPGVIRTDEVVSSKGDDKGGPSPKPKRPKRPGF